MQAISVQDLSKTYSRAFGRGRVEALQDVDLGVERGEIFGLLGPNGAGKTTLVKILLGVVHATSGQARMLGRPVRDPEARRDVGFLPENHRFPDFLTAEQMLDLYGRMSGVPGPERRRRIPELLDRVGMDRWRTTRIGKYSKGMMQRIGLAQAMLGRPALIFLDEPTDGVDPVGRREIRDLLLWMRDEGTTVFLNSHLLSEVEQVCTRVAILNGGRVVRQGTVAELTTAEPTWELVTTPLPEGLRERLPVVRPLNGAAPPEGLARYAVRPADRAELNAVLDHLRAAGVEIEALHPLRQTLEDYFIDVVRNA